MKSQKVNELLSRRKKCAIYIRVSSERQVQGFSLDGQKRELIEYAKTKQLEVADIYVEEGRSGKSIEGREAFQKMMYDVTRQDSEVGYVLVFKLSRFGRNIRDILNSINILNKYGIHLLTKEEGIDSSNSMGGLMITIIGTLAEVERENIITQTMLGREEKSRQGGWCGGLAPLGYDIQNERLVKNEYAYLIELIFDKYVNENVGIKGIVDYLNKNGIKKPIPKNRLDYQFTDWSTHTIKNILDNPVYTGFIVFGRRRTVECVNQKTGEIEYKLKKQDKDNYVWSDEKAHEQIISREMFDLAQLKRKNRACKGNRQIGQAPVHLLSGLLKCPQCGSGMVVNYNKWKNKDGTSKQTRTYICGHYNRAGAYGQCNRNGIAANLIEKEVVEYTKRLIHNDKFTNYVKMRIGQSIDVTEIEKELAEYDKKLKALERNKNVLEKEIDNLLDDDKVANRKRVDMNKRLDKIYLDMDSVETERTECQERLDAVKKQQLSEQNIYKILLEFDRIYDKLSMEDKGKLLHSLISEIQLYNKDEIMESKTYIKKIKFAFDVQNVDNNLGDKGNNVETFDGHVQINRYDAEGLRHEMEEDGRLVQFIFRGDEIAAETKDSNVIRYIRGYDLIASDAESARTYYHYASDEMSSITHIVGSTHEMGAEQILNHYEYDAWGNTAVCEETVENRVRFNGQQYDPITRQYYLRARFYNPVIARFTQEDTYRGDGLNLYAYCRNNPVHYIDPSGHMPACMKEAYDQAIADGKSKAEAYKLGKEAYWKGQYGDRNPTVEIPDVQGMTRDQWKDAYREARGADNLIYQAEKAIGKSSREVYNKAGIDNYDNLKVIAIYEHGGDVYMDVNPTARRKRSTSTQPIGIVVKNKEGQDVHLSSGGKWRMFDTPFNMHAEVGQCYNQHILAE